MQVHDVPKGARKYILIHSDLIVVHVRTTGLAIEGELSRYKLKRLNNLEISWRSPRVCLLPLGSDLNSQTG